MILLFLSLLAACNKPKIAERVGDDDAWYLVMGNPNTDAAWGIDRGGDGDLFVATHLANPSQTDGYVFRFSDTGEEQWQAEWGGAYTEELFAVDVADGVVHVAGASFNSLGVQDTRAVHFSLDASDGALREDRWSLETAGWDEVDGLAVADDGTWLSGWAGGDIFLALLDEHGSERWSVRWDSGGWDEANGALALDEEHVYVAGRTDGVNELVGGDGVLIAFDRNDGEVVWTETYGDDGTEDALGLCSDGERIYGVGVAETLWVAAWSMDGEALWQATPDAETGRALALSPEGELVVAANRDGDIVLLELDPEDGTTLNEHIWGGSGTDTVHGLVLGEGRGWMVGETSSTGFGAADALVLGFSTDPWALPLEP